MTPSQASELTGYSISHIRKLIRDGEVKAKKSPHLGGYHYNIPRKEIEKLKTRTKDNRGSNLD